MDTLDPATTSLLWTYRYLRIAIALTVVIIFVAVAVAFLQFGVLGSISAYFYTPARTAFTGALIAASLGLFAISGRGPERALLDLAAMFAPIIAFVSAPISADEVHGVPGCATTFGCIPHDYVRSVDNGVLTYLVVGAIVLGVAVGVVWRASHVQGNINVAGARRSIVGAALVLLAVGLAYHFLRQPFLQWAHLGAAVIFFLLVGAVAAVNVGRPRPNQPRWATAQYRTIAVLFLLDFIYVAITIYQESHGAWDSRAPLILIGEVIPLTLFVWFWILESANKWNDASPSLRLSLLPAT